MAKLSCNWLLVEPFRCSFGPSLFPPYGPRKNSCTVPICFTGEEKEDQIPNTQSNNLKVLQTVTKLSVDKGGGTAMALALTSIVGMEDG